MRRAELEVKDRGEIEAILRKAKVCRIAMCEGNKPYVVPVLPGYEDNALYFHSATEGKKVEMLRANPRVCFEVDIDVEVVLGKAPCASSVKYRSVIGWGRAEFVEGEEEKAKALDVIMRHHGGSFMDYAGSPEAKKAMSRVAVVKIEIEKMTGKATV